MGKFIKRHLLPFGITAFSLLVTIFVEPYISPDVLGCLLLIIAMTVSVTLWKKLKSKFPIIIISLLALIFHNFRDIVLSRQIALTILIAGVLVGILHVLGFEEPRNRG